MTRHFQRPQILPGRRLWRKTARDPIAIDIAFRIALALTTVSSYITSVRPTMSFIRCHRLLLLPLTAAKVISVFGYVVGYPVMSVAATTLLGVGGVDLPWATSTFGVDKGEHEEFALLEGDEDLLAGGVLSQHLPAYRAFQAGVALFVSCKTSVLSWYLICVTVALCRSRLRSRYRADNSGVDLTTERAATDISVLLRDYLVSKKVR